jgi:ribosomal protein S18 acetylase RimI-like enzyme
MDNGEQATSDADITVLRALDAATYAGLCGLLPQLSTTTETPSFEQLRDVIEAPSNHVLAARLRGETVGMLTVVVLPMPTGRVARIEDVVVSEAARGQGIGRALALAAVEVARAAGAKHVELTSRPSREAANNLYRSLGFVARDTNVYRLPLRD